MISVFVHFVGSFIRLYFRQSLVSGLFSIPRRKNEQEVSKPLNTQTKLSAVHCKSDDLYLNNNGCSCKKFRSMFYVQIAT